MAKILRDIYLRASHPSSFGGARKLYEAAHNVDPSITTAFVKKWLEGQDSYTLNKPLKRKFQRSRLISPGLFVQNDVDLADVSNLSEANDGVTFLLVSIDTLSRKLYVQPLKSKRGQDVAVAFEKLWGNDPIPKLIRSDSGKEFLNSKVQHFFKRNNIHHFTTSNEVKAHLAERVIRTLRSRLKRLITHTQNNSYIDQLQDIVGAYNDSLHSSIGMAPSRVTKTNERAVWWTQYWPKTQNKKPKQFLFKVDDHVRISYLRKAFTREADYSYSGEVFKVVRRTRRDTIPVYKLIDLLDEPILGTFYSEELSKVAPGDIWKIDKIVRTRKRRGHPKESLIKWLHFPDKHQSWVRSDSIVDI